jgi:hypothetical protein
LRQGGFGIVLFLSSPEFWLTLFCGVALGRDWHHITISPTVIYDIVQRRVHHPAPGEHSSYRKCGYETHRLDAFHHSAQPTFTYDCLGELV